MRAAKYLPALARRASERGFLLTIVEFTLRFWHSTRVFVYFTIARLLRSIFVKKEGTRDEGDREHQCSNVDPSHDLFPFERQVVEFLSVVRRFERCGHPSQECRAQAIIAVVDRIVPRHQDVTDEGEHDGDSALPGERRRSL
jgi:hypothetical protein